jgi:phenylpropionate dioxygenase-like ring-hydroxylating dioxygenase large terminal subunit
MDLPPQARHAAIVEIDEQRSVVQALLDMLDGSAPQHSGELAEHGIDAYVSEEFAALEEEHIFASVPQLVALSCELPDTGSVLTEMVGPAPVVLVRGGDNRVRAFLNVCRHRGSPVELERCATRRSLMCPYHGWTYGFDGELLAISDTVAFPGVDPSTRGLVSLPVLEVGGMVFVHPRPDGTIEHDDDLDRLVAGLSGYGLESLHPWRSKEFHYDFNWKLALETFHETYHFAWLHANTVAGLLHGNRSHFTPWGRHHRMAIPRRSIDRLRETDPDTWDCLDHLVIVHQVFPNTLVVWLKDHVEMWRAYPDHRDPGRCRVRLTLLTPDPVESEEQQAHWELNWKITMDTVDNEDFRVAAGIQQAMGSGAQDTVVYGTNEPAMRHFTRNVRSAVGQR